jgi:hypothetical protein
MATLKRTAEKGLMGNRKIRDGICWTDFQETRELRWLFPLPAGEGQGGGKLLLLLQWPEFKLKRPKLLPFHYFNA